MANIWDSNGKLIGSTRISGNGKINTYDSRQQPLGTVNNLGTFGKGGTKISKTQDPGLTFKKFW